MAHILLGVTGSIAAFKACHLASDWSKQGHEVRVVMAAAAQEFVTPLTFSSLTHTPTRTSMFAAGHRPGATADVAPGPDGPLQISHVATRSGRICWQSLRRAPISSRKSPAASPMTS